MQTAPRLYGRRLAALASVLLLGALACNLPFGSQPTPTPPPGGIATLSELKNSAESSAATGAQWVPAAVGQVLSAGGGVRTGPDARARLDTGDASVVRLDGGTTLSLAALPGGAGGSATRLSLEIGQIWALVSAAPGAGSFEIATPDALVSAQRGSLVNVWYYPDTGRVVVTCLGGVCRLNGSNGVYTDLTGGQQSEIVSTGQDPTTGGPMDGLQLTGWGNEVPEAQPVLAQITPAAPAAAAEANLTQGEGGAISQTRLAFDGQGVLHLFWRSDRLRPAGDYLHQQLPPGGNWSQPQALTDGFEFLDIGPQILVDGSGKVCALWTGGPSQSDSGGWGLYQTCQSDGVWSQPERATGQTGDFGAAFAPDGTLPTLAFERLNGMFYGDTLLSGAGGTVLPRLAVDGTGGFHAFWVNLAEPFAVVHRASTDGGQNWSPEEQVSESEAGPNGLELVAVSDSLGNVHVAWVGDAVYYRRWSPADGWGAVEQVQSAGGGLQLSADTAGRAWLAWAGGGEAFFASQRDGGVFGAPTPVGGLGAGNPAVAVDEQGLGHVVWQQSGDLWYTTIGP